MAEINTSELGNRSLFTSRLWVHKFNERMAQVKAQGRVKNTTSPPFSDNSVSRVMQDSFVQVFLPFASDEHLRDEYSSHFGRIRVGKVLEDLDALAGYISFMHCAEALKPLAVVTASVDRMDLISEIPANLDVSLSGHVTYVGKSSMEVIIKLMPIHTDAGLTLHDMESIAYLRTPLPANKLTGDVFLIAKFIMVSLDATTGRPAPAPPLTLTNSQETALFEAGARHKARKQLAAQASPSLRVPDLSEMQLVHSIFLEYMKYLDANGNPDPAKAKPKNVVWMKDTTFQNLVLTFPQDRNVHNKIFGGHLMRLGFELGYATGVMFCKRPLQFLALDDITFKKPVDVGSVLDLTSQVVYSFEDKIVVKVAAHIVQADEGSHYLSNEFWFTFKTVAGKNDDGQHPQEWMRILPRSYDECMLYLAGKRRLEIGLGEQGDSIDKPHD
ncbi:hypothetical protein HK100_011125 [Physocladia obscura]|uniref:HotDog ACOT-type domain-containing protein n=1 Tax=Physocladia obscura TaxID=109957 RepID=A0AAD5T3L8_9FUNG|nr:hypothetical protein HK100_011125 [Physocladia obscura]